MNQLKISIISREKVAYQGEALEAIIPTKDGLITVLPNHLQLVSALAPGKIILKTLTGQQDFTITSGVLEVKPKSQVILLVN